MSFSAWLSWVTSGSAGTKSLKIETAVIVSITISQPINYSQATLWSTASNRG